MSKAAPAAASSRSVASMRPGDDGWQALFWVVFTRSKNAMALLDSDRRMVAVNDAQVELFGYPRPELVGRRLDVLLDPEEWRSLDAEWRDFLRRGDLEGERGCRRADGRHVAVQYAMRWARLDGRVLALVVVLEASVEPLRTRLAEVPAVNLLTPREIEIVGHIAMGQRAGEIAAELGIAETTVRSHIRNAMRKSGARSQAQLVALVCVGGMPQTSLTA
ncbi:MAG TPA: PAS and helix-turn-helix domain-containing protein [Solirubrobacteraceae bacterium]|jgi:PAS domain S-box-containing protein